jgi:hypothetical protein
LRLSQWLDKNVVIHSRSKGKVKVVESAALSLGFSGGRDFSSQRIKNV